MVIDTPKNANYKLKRGMKIYLMPDGKLQARKRAPWHDSGTCIGVIYSVKDLKDGLFLHFWSKDSYKEAVQ